MSLPSEINLLQFGQAVAVSDTSTRSLRFRSANSPYLKRTPSIAGNQQKWTWSGWVKRSATGATHNLFSARTGASATYTLLYFDSTDKLALAGDSFAAGCLTTGVFRDVGAWYHIVCAVDTTQATATLTGSSTDRIRMWVNGVQITSFSTVTLPAQNASLNINSTADHYISFNNSSNYLDGYLTEVYFVDGQSLSASSFGQSNATTGVWQPITYSGTYGINGFYLNFSKNSSTTLCSNLMQYSETITQGVWSSSSILKTGSSTTAPNGSNTGVRLYGASVTGEHYITQLATCTASTTYTIGIYAKQDTYYNIAIRESTTTAEAMFNLSTGTVNYAINGASATITSAGNGWYRCQLTVTTGAAQTTISPLFLMADNSNSLSFLGSFANGIFIWGGFVSIGSTPIYLTTTTPAITTSQFQLGADISNGVASWNSYYPTNLSLTSGPTYDSTTDHPSIFGGDNGAGGEIRGNYCTLNVLSGLGNGTYSDAGSSFVSGVLSTWKTAIGTQYVTQNYTTGKFYYEATVTGVTSGNYFMPGVCGLQTNNTLVGTYVGAISNGWGFQWPSGAPALRAGVTYSVSSTYSTNSPPTYAFMNDSNANGSTNGNQWGSNTEANPFITADCGSTIYISKIVIGYDYLNNLPGGWGVSYTEGLDVQTSTDNATWTTRATTPLYSSTGSVNGLVDVSVGVNARYVRLTAASGYIATLEFQVWGFTGSGTDGLKWNNNASTVVTTITPIINYVLKVAFDVDNGRIWFGINNVWVEGNPAAGTGASFTGLPSVLAPAISCYSNAGDKLSVNFGQRPFTYTAPSGFRALCTSNITIIPIGQ